jgi:hypothetical protein
VLPDLTDLYLYDLDGTLFRSPDQPAWWEEFNDGWFFDHHMSLDMPCVPPVPGDEWWAVNIVKGARVALDWPHVHSVLCTGRRGDVFSHRVHELLGQQGLEFDEINCRPPDADTKQWKVSIFLGHLAETPTINRVVIFDDDEEKMAFYVRVLSPLVEVVPFPVKMSKPKDLVTQLVDRFVHGVEVPHGNRHRH